jgi:hypothetical protein
MYSFLNIVDLEISSLIAFGGETTGTNGGERGCLLIILEKAPRH